MEKENKLTPKQENFCRLVASGKSHYEAYKLSYDTKTQNRETIDNMVFQVAKLPEIKARIKELNAKIEIETIKKTTKTREKLIDEFEELIAIVKESTKIKQTEDGSYTKAIDIDKAIREIRECLKEEGKLLGYYVERKEIKDTSQHESWLELMKGE